MKRSSRVIASCDELRAHVFRGTGIESFAHDEVSAERRKREGRTIKSRMGSLKSFLTLVSRVYFWRMYKLDAAEAELVGKSQETVQMSAQLS